MLLQPLSGVHSPWRQEVRVQRHCAVYLLLSISTDWHEANPDLCVKSRVDSQQGCFQEYISIALLLLVFCWNKQCKLRIVSLGSPDSGHGSHTSLYRSTLQSASSPRSLLLECGPLMSISMSPGPRPQAGSLNRTEHLNKIPEDCLHAGFSRAAE